MKHYSWNDFEFWNVYTLVLLVKCVILVIEIYVYLYLKRSGNSKFPLRWFALPSKSASFFFDLPEYKEQEKKQSYATWKINEDLRQRRKKEETGMTKKNMWW